MKNRFKVAALLMALVMLMGSVASASGLPSKVVTDVVAPSANDSAGTIVTVDQSTATLTDIATIGTFGGLSYFSASVQAEILALGSVSTIYEIAGMGTIGTWISGASVWSLGTQFKVGQKVVAVIGFKSGSAYTWYAVPARVITIPNAAGTFVRVDIPRAIWDLGVGKTALLAFLA